MYVRAARSFAVGVFAGEGWLIAIPCHRGSRGGRPGHALEFLPIHGWNVLRVILVFFWILVVGGKGCSSAGQPSSSVIIGILAVTEAEILLPDQISAVPMGCKSAVSSVATFLPITDGHVAWPPWVWNASSI